MVQFPLRQPCGNEEGRQFIRLEKMPQQPDPLFTGISHSVGFPALGKPSPVRSIRRHTKQEAGEIDLRWMKLPQQIGVIGNDEPQPAVVVEVDGLKREWPAKLPGEVATLLPQVVVFDGRETPWRSVQDSSNDSMGIAGRPSLGDAMRGHNNSPMDSEKRRSEKWSAADDNNAPTKARQQKEPRRLGRIRNETL